MEGFEKEIIDTIKSSFGIALNANDFFEYNCPDMVFLDYENFHWAFPIIRKYDIDGENAVMSKIRNQLPLKEYQNKKFKEALNEINSMDIEVMSD